MALRSSVHAGAPATTKRARPLRYLYASGANVAYSSSLEQSTTMSALASRAASSFYGVETEVVYDFISCTTKEVGGKLRARKTHGEVAYGEHEYYRLM